MKESIFFFLLILVLACSKDKTTLSSTDDIIMYPDSGYIGTQVIFYGMDSELDSWDYSIRFSGDVVILTADSVRGDTGFSRVPFGAVTGPVQLDMKDGSITFQKFAVLEDSPDSVQVKWYDLLNPLSEKQALIYSWDGEIPWEGTMKSDTVVLTNSGLCGDECNYKFELMFKNSPLNDLPEFISLSRIRTSYFPAQKDTFNLKAGIIKIQDYNTNGIVSGRVFCKMWSNNPLTFWYDFGQK